jgi:hypothetical protein
MPVCMTRIVYGCTAYSSNYAAGHDRRSSASHQAQSNGGRTDALQPSWPKGFGDDAARFRYNAVAGYRRFGRTRVVDCGEDRSSISAQHTLAMAEAAVQGGVALLPVRMFERDLRQGRLAPPFPIAITLGADWRTRLKSRSDLVSSGAPWWIRTTDPQLRRLLLYPTELRAQTRSDLNGSSCRRDRCGNCRHRPWA